MHKPALTLGRQRDSECIVLAPDIHVKEDGTVIPIREREYFWVESIVRSKGIVPRGIDYSSKLPDYGESHLHTLLVGLKEITQENFMSVIFVLGKCSFYVHACEDYLRVFFYWVRLYNMRILIEVDNITVLTYSYMY